MKEQIIKKIREVCPETMELSFGCKYIQGGDGAIEIEDYIIGKNTSGKITVRNRDFQTGENCPRDVKQEELKGKIIGHPLNLQHLLRAIPMSEDIKINHWGRFLTIQLNAGEATEKNSKYNLEKSLEENLENEDLCNLLADLLALTK